MPQGMSAKEAGSDPLQRSLEKSVLRKAPADSPPRGRKAVNAPAAAAEEEHVEAREVREGPEGSEAPHERDEALGSSVDEEVTAAAEAAVAEDDVPEVVEEEAAAALTEAAAAGEPSGEQASAGERQQSASPPPAVTTYRVPKEATQGGRLHTLRLYVVATMISFGFQVRRLTLIPSPLLLRSTLTLTGLESGLWVLSPVLPLLLPGGGLPGRVRQPMAAAGGVHGAGHRLRRPPARQEVPVQPQAAQGPDHDRLGR